MAAPGHCILDDVKPRAAGGLSQRHVRPEYAESIESEMLPNWTHERLVAVGKTQENVVVKRCIKHLRRLSCQTQIGQLRWRASGDHAHDAAIRSPLRHSRRRRTRLIRR